MTIAKFYTRLRGARAEFVAHSQYFLKYSRGVSPAFLFHISEAENARGFFKFSFPMVGGMKREMINARGCSNMVSRGSEERGGRGGSPGGFSSGRRFGLLRVEFHKDVVLV